MKRVLTILLLALLVLPQGIALSEESFDAAAWSEAFNGIWSQAIPTAFVFDEIPADGALLSGSIGESFVLTITASDEEAGKIEVKAEIIGSGEVSEEEDAQPFVEEKTYVLIAFCAAIQAQRPDLTANNELINELTMSVSEKIFLDADFAAAYDGVEKTADLDGGIAYEEYFSSEEEVMWYALIL